MTTRLDLPPERDLPETRRREIRADLLHAARPARRHRRAWAVVVPLAVLAVVLGLGLTRPAERTPAVVGLPSPAPTTASPTAPPSAGPPPVAIPSARPIDRGPLDASTVREVAGRCGADTSAGTAVVDVLFARRTSVDGDVVVYTDRSGQTSLCTDSALAILSSTSSSRDPLPHATGGRPVVRLSPADPLTSTGAGHDYTSASAVYGVAPEVASLQLRLVVRGRPGAWFEASRSGDFAWAGARVSTAITDARIGTDLEIEDRAFDDAGRPLPIDRTSR